MRAARWLRHSDVVVRLSLAVCCILPWIYAVPAVAGQADEVSVRVGLAERTTYVGQPVRCQIVVNGSRESSPPTIPPTPGLTWDFLGGQDQTSSSVVIINGRRTERRTEAYVFWYNVTPEVAGRHEIPPISVVVNGRQIQSDPAVLTATPPTERDDLKVQIEVDNTRPYVGEPIGVKVTLYLRRAVRRPTFRLPGVNDRFEAYPGRPGAKTSEGNIQLLGMDVPAIRGTDRLDGREYNTYTMSCYLVPLQAGQQQLGPMTLACDVVIREGWGMFDSDVTETAVVPSNELTLDVQPVPEAGRPANFTGLVGRYRISSAARPTEVNVGDPITLTVRVQAEGPVLRKPDIRLDAQPGFADAFRVSADTPEPETQGTSLVYQFTIRPQRESVKRIPGIELPCFNTESGSYETVTSDPIDLKVRPTRIVTADDAVSSGGNSAAAGPAGVEVSDVSEGIAHNYTAPDELLVHQQFDLRSAVFRSPAVIAAIAGPPFAYAVCAVWLFVGKSEERRRIARRRSRALGRAKQTMQRGRESTALERVAGAVRGYLADRFDILESALTTEECVRLAREVNEEAAAQIAHVLAVCDAAKYGGSAGHNAEGGVESIQQEAIDALMQLDRSRRSRSQAATLTITPALLVGMAAVMLVHPRSALAQADAEAAPLLTRANELFSQAIETRKTDPTNARAEFQQSIDLWQRLIDERGIVNGKLYYNIGNAYLLAGDVGHAIVNYRRAERYLRGDANLAANLDYARRQVATRIELEVQARIRRILFFWHYDLSPQTRFLAFVILSACAWCWGLLHLWWPRIRGNTHGRRPVLWPALFVGFVALACLGSLLVEEASLRSQFGAQAVVIRPAEGRKGPSAIGYEASFSEALAPGVEVSVETRRGDWVLVRLRDARETWLQRADIEVI